ncbi:MAG TPA: aryl-sulfate sulfotransferase [Bryobacteraceae bacterium]|nr:aryl-sulfate sulfotransferase [Bryobacteraceae bacterium]
MFRYSVSVNGGPFRIVRDFSQESNFIWSPELYEHSATIRLIARNNESKETAQDDMRFQIVSRIKGKNPVVTPSANPLVALFSAPTCPEGSNFRVAFHADGEETMTRTSAQPCRGSISNNVWVAGMRADTEYRMRPEWISGTSVKSGDWAPFHTGLLDGRTAPVSITVPRTGGSPASEGVLIYSSETLGGGKGPFATDLQGRVIWYLLSSDSMTRVLPGGRFLLIGEGKNSVNSTKDEQCLREVDLAGNILRETNAGRVAEQLAAHGIHSDCRIGGKECVSGFHHEAIRLPNGHTMVIAGMERMMPAGTQGSKDPVDILGDVVVDLDEEFQVSNVWKEYEYLDINRKSVFDAKCHTGQGGCPPVLLAAEAYGWTHSNSLNYIPSTGDFLVSIPEQDWIVKVDWKNGKGSGKILWRLGKGGDFTVEAKDPNPWFSYAHDVGFEPAGSNNLTLMDDAHTNHAKDNSANGRAQMWRLDEQNRKATLTYNADLGQYSICCGTFQILKDGGYLSVTGFVNLASPHGRTVETDKDGKIVFAIELEGVIDYRSFRVEDMYSAPVK